MYVFIYFKAVGRLDKHKSDATPHRRHKAGSSRFREAFATRVINGHSISLCILKCSVRIQSRLPPMFVTVLCTIDERLCVSNTHNKASVVLPPPDASLNETPAFACFIFHSVNEFSFGFARENKKRRGTESNTICRGLKT